MSSRSSVNTEWPYQRPTTRPDTPMYRSETPAHTTGLNASVSTPILNTVECTPILNTTEHTPILNTMEYTPIHQSMHYGEGDAKYYPNFLTKDEADDFLTRLKEELHYIPREEMTFKIYGKTIPLPRDKAFLGDVADDGSYPLYRYDPSGKHPVVNAWTATTENIRGIIKTRTGQRNNHLVANRYLNRDDHIGFHQDKARDFATDSSVMTLSLGGARQFRLLNMKTNEKQTMLLEHGSLFVLGPKTNATWKHSILKGSRRERCETRLGLTYRHIATRYNPTTEEVRMNVL